MATETRVPVQFGRLTEALQTCSVPTGTTVKLFCDKKKIKYGSSIRVNGETVQPTYTLQENDIITDIDNVSGGR
jgi:hypothetical protein